MSHCSEFAIFHVPQAHIPRVIALSAAIVDEINADETLVLSQAIFQSVDHAEELCWHLTWINHEAVQLTAQRWPSLPSTAELESLVGKKVYYGHFTRLF